MDKLFEKIKSEIDLEAKESVIERLDFLTLGKCTRCVHYIYNFREKKNGSISNFVANMI